MPKKEIVSTDKVAVGAAPLSQATKLGNLVFVAGNTGRHPTNGEAGKDIKEQTRYALERIKLILEAAGSSMDNVLTNTCYVTNRGDLAFPIYPASRDLPIGLYAVRRPGR